MGSPGVTSSQDTSPASSYPLPLRALVQAHGASAVDAVGLDALGYPVSWIDRADECLLVLEAFAGRKAKGV